MGMLLTRVINITTIFEAVSAASTVDVTASTPTTTDSDITAADAKTDSVTDTDALSKVMPLQLPSFCYRY